MKSFLLKVHTVLQNAVCWNFVLGKSRLGSAWGRFGPGVEQARSQARSRSRPGVAPESDLGCFPVLPERSKMHKKLRNPGLESAIWGASLKAPGTQKQQPEIADSRGDLLKFHGGHENEIPTRFVL